MNSIEHSTLRLVIPLIGMALALLTLVLAVLAYKEAKDSGEFDDK